MIKVKISYDQEETGFLPLENPIFSTNLQTSTFRYFPVANLTRTRQAVIIEPLRPEKFHVKTFNATSLYILSICEVCGSYQCPYCPFYSAVPTIHPNISFVIFITFVSLLLSWDRTRNLLSTKSTL